jgi:hypothetical protein
MKNDSKMINSLVEENKRLKIENSIYTTQERLKKQDEQLIELQRSKEEREYDVAVKMNEYLAKLIATGLSHAAAFEKAMSDPYFQILYEEYSKAYKDGSTRVGIIDRRD